LTKALAEGSTRLNRRNSNVDINASAFLLEEGSEGAEVTGLDLGVLARIAQLFDLRLLYIPLFDGCSFIDPNLVKFRVDGSLWQELERVFHLLFLGFLGHGCVDGGVLFILLLLRLLGPGDALVFVALGLDFLEELFKVIYLSLLQLVFNLRK